MKKTFIILMLLALPCSTFAKSRSDKSCRCPYLEGKSISILGDSYSTFSNWVPKDYALWYTSTQKSTDAHKVEDTWWWKLCDKTHCTLLTNSSYSGSTICNTGYHGKDATQTSFITRMKKDLGEEKALSSKPQVLFIFGGTNDSWANSPLGEPQYDNWTTEDLFKTFPATCYMLDYLKRWNPGTKIIFISNSELKKEFYTGIQTICQHYQIDLIQLENIKKQAGHPNIEGMESISEQIIKYINKQK